MHLNFWKEVFRRPTCSICQLLICRHQVKALHWKGCCLWRWNLTNIWEHEHEHWVQEGPLIALKRLGPSCSGAKWSWVPPDKFCLIMIEEDHEAQTKIAAVGLGLFHTNIWWRYEAYFQVTGTWPIGHSSTFDDDLAVEGSWHILSAWHPSNIQGSFMLIACCNW
jgi:hypothetical protein